MVKVLGAGVKRPPNVNPGFAVLHDLEKGSSHLQASVALSPNYRYLRFKETLTRVYRAQHMAHSEGSLNGSHCHPHILETGPQAMAFTPSHQEVWGVLGDPGRTARFRCSLECS